MQRQPPKYWGLPSGTEHLSRTASRRGGKRYERGNLKSRIACRRPFYNTRAKRGRGTRGKVSFPPCSMCSAFTKCNAHSHWLAVCIACRGAAERRWVLPARSPRTKKERLPGSLPLEGGMAKTRNSRKILSAGIYFSTHQCICKS